MSEDLTKTTQFFVKGSVHEEIENEKLLYGESLPQLELELQGYGSFYPIELQDNFLQAATLYLRTFTQVKWLRVQLGGFKETRMYQDGTTIVSRLCEIIEKVTSITRLHLNFPNFSSGTPADFFRVMKLVGNTDFKFEEVQLNFSNWTMPLSMGAIEQLLKPLIDARQFTKFEVFRLQISGWFYKNEHILLDEPPKNSSAPPNSVPEEYEKERLRVHRENIQRMHETVKRLVNLLFEFAKNELCLDLRNWNEQLKMKDLKKVVDNLTKTGSYEKSLVQNNMRSAFEDNTKEFKFTFLV